MDRRARMHRAVTAFLVCYAALFIVHCRLDDAPPTWDDAYLLQYPMVVKVAWDRDGLVPAVRAFWRTRFMKPPLSMLGTMVPLFLVGTDGVSYRLDNLVVAVASALVLTAFLARSMSGAWAATFAMAILVSPYALRFARSEMAELYLWATLIVFLALLLDGDDFRTLGRSLTIGTAFGAGLLAKLSFPLLVLGPGAWSAGRTIRAGLGEGDLRQRVRNVALAGVAAAATFLPFAAHNLQRMWQHLADQYGWPGDEYRMGNPFTREYAAAYFRTFGAWVGSVWLALGVVLALVLVATYWRAELAPRGPDRRRAVPWAPLVAALALNVAYCYFHPVAEPRFLVGGFLAFQLIVALALGRLIDGSKMRSARFAAVMLVPSVIVLLANSDLPNGRRALPWDVPLLGRAADVVSAPAHAPDLRDAIWALATTSSTSTTIAIAGDHERLNADNLYLRAIENGVRVNVRQIAYMPPDIDVPDRMRAIGMAVPWVLIRPAANGRGVSWASRYALPVQERLDAMSSAFRRLPWTGDLGDGTQVLIYVPDGR